MSSHTVRSFMSLSRLSISAFGPHGSVSRVAYSTAFVKNQSGRKGQRSRGKDALTRRTKRVPVAPRAEKMSVDQDWTSVYPAAAAYKPSAVPLPVRMGFPVKGGAPPEKWGNLELIKIPNFLHLTPNAIKKHCKALEPFCTKWPAALDTDAKCDQFFPVKVKTTDYVSAGLSIRNPSARIVELRVKLSSLNLDDHARKKMVKLAGEKYCSDSDVLTITTDRCPLRQQNQDYAMYLLTVLYHESWKTEAWEADKTVADMEEYHWEDSPSQKNILDTLVRMRSAGEGEEVREQLLGRSEVQQYKDSVTRLKNEGENEDTVLQYKEAVKKVLSL